MLKMKHTGLGRLIVVLAAIFALAPLSAFAQRGEPRPVEPPEVDCTFTEGVSGRIDVWMLNASCSTSESIVLPHATKLDGNGHTIWAVPPPEGGVFEGAVITNEPPVGNERVTIYVDNVKIKAADMAGCEGGDTSLRGVWLNGASGGVTNVTILGLNRFESGCQEGNGIDADNLGGSYFTNVTIANNTVLHWQKRGIVAQGSVRVKVLNNYIGESANQQFLAPNGIGVYYGATGLVQYNEVHGNEWFGEADASASGILIYQAGSVQVMDNKINVGPDGGNSDRGIGIVETNNSWFIRNIINDNGEDGPHGDIGIFADCASSANIFGANQITGFDTPTSICASGDESESGNGRGDA